MIRLTARLVGIPEARQRAAIWVNGLPARVEGLLNILGEKLRGILTDATPRRTGQAQGGWAVVRGFAGIRVVNPVPHVQFLIEGTGARRAAGIVNPGWHGMAPSDTLRPAWLAVPQTIEEFMATEGSALLTI